MKKRKGKKHHAHAGTHHDRHHGDHGKKSGAVPTHPSREEHAARMRSLASVSDGRAEKESKRRTRRLANVPL